MVYILHYEEFGTSLLKAHEKRSACYNFLNRHALGNMWRCCIIRSPENFKEIADKNDAGF